MSIGKRDESGAWKPASAKVVKLVTLAERVRNRTNNGEDLLDVLMTLLADPSPKIRLAATQELLNRGFGKPVDVSAQIDAGPDFQSAALAALDGVDVTALARRAIAQRALDEDNATSWRGGELPAKPKATTENSYVTIPSRPPGPPPAV